MAPSPRPCSSSCGIGKGEARPCCPAPAPHRPVRPSGVVWGREVQDPHHELPASRSISAVGLLGGAVTALPALCPVPEAKDIATPTARCSNLGAAPHVPTAPSSPVTTESPRSQLEAAPLIASPSSTPPWHHFVPFGGFPAPWARGGAVLLLPLLAAGRFWGGSRGSRAGMICHRPFPFLLFFFFLWQLFWKATKVLQLCSFFFHVNPRPRCAGEAEPCPRELRPDEGTPDGDLQLCSSPGGANSSLGLPAQILSPCAPPARQPHPLCASVWCWGLWVLPVPPSPRTGVGSRLGGDPNPWDVPGAGCSDPSPRWLHFSRRGGCQQMGLPGGQ